MKIIAKILLHIIFFIIFAYGFIFASILIGEMFQNESKEQENCYYGRR